LAFFPLGGGDSLTRRRIASSNLICFGSTIGFALGIGIPFPFSGQPAADRAKDCAEKSSVAL
jgi:hypothetical protein